MPPKLEDQENKTGAQRGTSAREDHADACISLKKPNKRKRLLPTDEAAAYLGLAPRTLYNGSGRKAKVPFPVKPKRIGRKLLWDIRELEAYVDSLD